MFIRSPLVSALIGPTIFPSRFETATTGPNLRFDGIAISYHHYQWIMIADSEHLTISDEVGNELATYVIGTPLQITSSLIDRGWHLQSTNLYVTIDEGILIVGSTPAIQITIIPVQCDMEIDHLSFVPLSAPLRQSVGIFDPFIQVPDPLVNQDIFHPIIQGTIGSDGTLQYRYHFTNEYSMVYYITLLMGMVVHRITLIYNHPDVVKILVDEFEYRLYHRNGKSSYYRRLGTTTTRKREFMLQMINTYDGLRELIEYTYR